MEESKNQNSNYYDAIWILSDINRDLKTARDNYNNYFKFEEAGVIGKMTQENLGSLKRLTFFSLILSLCKFKEAFEHYNDEFKLLDEQLINALNDVDKKITDKRMRVFRNKYICHIFDKSGNKVRPLTVDKASNRLKEIIGETDVEQEEFLTWIYKERDESCVTNAIYNAIVAFQEKSGAYYRFK
ncbi:hypothetical protein KS876_004420 [Vibrio parahaemolyticus]|nr:hypothetical protein [Vibrio parahaemolyticus]